MSISSGVFRLRWSHRAVFHWQGYPPLQQLCTTLHTNCDEIVITLLTTVTVHASGELVKCHRRGLSYRLNNIKMKQAFLALRGVWIPADNIACSTVCSTPFLAAVQVIRSYGRAGVTRIFVGKFLPPRVNHSSQFKVCGASRWCYFVRRDTIMIPALFTSRCSGDPVNASTLVIIKARWLTFGEVQCAVSNAIISMSIGVHDPCSGHRFRKWSPV